MTVPMDRTGRLVLIAALLTVFDAAATWSWLQLGFVEGNPVVRAAVDVLGPTAGLAVRAVWGLTLLAGLGWLARHHWFADAALLGVALSMAIVGIVHIAGGTATVMALG